MIKVKNDNYYLRKIINNMTFIIECTRGVTFENFQENLLLQDSMVFRLIQISENIDKLSNEFKLIYKAIPWNNIKGLRNRLVHDYGNIDIYIV